MEILPCVLCLLLWTGVTRGQHYPEGIHLSYGDDPSIMHVTWSTRKDPGDSVVQYGVVKSGQTEEKEVKEQVGPELEVVAEEVAKARRARQETKAEQLEELKQANRTAIAQTTPLVHGIFSSSKQFVHKARLTELLPGREYWYKCGSTSQDSWSVEGRLKVMPEGNNWAPRLAVFGDLGAVNHRILKRLIEDVKENSVDAVLHAGDIAYDLHSDEGRIGDLFLQEIEPVASRVPYMVAPGNHEAFRNFVNYKTRFFMPGPYENMMYSFRMGPMLVIAISTEAYYLFESGGRAAVNQQYKWLTSLLKEANLNRREIPWIVVFGHRPMYCSNRILRGCSTGNTRVPTRGHL